MNLEVTTTQKMVLTGKILQLFEMLQLDNIELAKYINNLVVENPVIELIQPIKKEYEDDNIIKKLRWLESTDRQNKTYYSLDYEDNKLFDQFANLTINSENDMYGNLLEQLYLLNLDEDSIKNCEFIIGSLSDNGFLTEDIEELSSLLGISIENCLKCINIVQSLEPAGICAKDFRQCLLLQLDRIGQKTTFIETLINNDLEALSIRKISALTKKYKVNKEDIIYAFHLIKNLNPRPGNVYFRENNYPYIIPDVIVNKFQGNFDIFLYNEYFPEISINSTYLKMLEETKDLEVKEYISSKLNQANWVTKAIKQRNHTLLATVDAIVKKQVDFFEKQGDLVPMRLFDISEMIKVHESTVSRTIKNKYLQFNRGVFPLEYFFTGKLSTVFGTIEATASVKKILSKLIETEDKKNPKSDKELTDLLNAQGIIIKRRTVAKYREELKFPIAAARKEI